MGSGETAAAAGGDEKIIIDATFLGSRKCDGHNQANWKEERLYGRGTNTIIKNQVSSIRKIGWN